LIRKASTYNFSRGWDLSTKNLFFRVGTQAATKGSRKLAPTWTRVARFFAEQYTKRGKYNQKMYQEAICMYITKGYEIYQKVIKYTKRL
jgi:hypothetical protein